MVVLGWRTVRFLGRISADMWRRKLRDRDLERELRAHLELEALENRENGLEPEEARFAARCALGNTTLLKETMREMWRWI
jgi:hypothetical protein